MACILKDYFYEAPSDRADNLKEYFITSEEDVAFRLLFIETYNNRISINTLHSSIRHWNSLSERVIFHYPTYSKTIDGECVDKIGRASCRERVWREVVDRAV